MEQGGTGTEKQTIRAYFRYAHQGEAKNLPGMIPT